VEEAENGRDGLRAALESPYDLIILDLVMPDVSGQEVLTSLLRQREDQPVLVLSCLGDVTSKVGCLELGARDYLTKPFSIDELLARVHVRMRLDRPWPSTWAWRIGRISVDLDHLHADAGNGPVPLTRLEFLLLRTLMEHEGESVSKQNLLTSVWGIDFDPGSNVVDVCVRRLRAKLGTETIDTVRGAGYRLCAR
jgi:DNA-binding response OmpR family regulator